MTYLKVMPFPPVRNLLAASACAVVLLTSAAAGQDRAPHGRLFPPEDLGLLEGPDRDAWQQPELIMDLLGIADGATVADVGAGGGWFTVRLARRVGPNGIVYAEDIQPQMLESLVRRVRREGLDNVLPVRGTPSNPQIPSQIDAVLIVDVYAEVADPVTLLRNLVPRLKPGGRIGIVDYKLDGGGPGPPDRPNEPNESRAAIYAIAYRHQIAPGTENVGTIWAISAETGATEWLYEQRAATMSLVATGGGLLFGGDTNGRFRAFSQETGEILWEINLGSPVSGFPISFGVDGRQYIAVATGSGGTASHFMGLTPELRPSSGNNLFVFALPDQN